MEDEIFFAKKLEEKLRKTLEDKFYNENDFEELALRIALRNYLNRYA